MKCEARVPATEGENDGDNFKACGKPAVVIVGGAVPMCEGCSSSYPEEEKAPI